MILPPPPIKAVMTAMQENNGEFMYKQLAGGIMQEEEAVGRKGGREKNKKEKGLGWTKDQLIERKVNENRRK
jgi:hypothetical protein